MKTQAVHDYVKKKRGLYAANGGLVAGTGQAWVMKTGTANRYFCIITSAAVQLSGTITFVSAP